MHSNLARVSASTASQRSKASNLAHARVDLAPIKAPPAALPAGDRSDEILSERYRLRDLLELGPLGVLYRCHDELSQEPCIAKLVPPCADPALQPERRIHHEADVLRRLDSPNIVKARELGRDAHDDIFLILEPLRGGSLKQLLRREQRLTLQRTISILRGVVAALECAHAQGIVHGDLKPSSIILHVDDAAGEVVKLIDWGLARILSAEYPDGAPTITPDKVIGATAFLPPEALFPERSRVDPRSDQWALAVLAYLMLTGRLPFASANPCAVGAMIREREPEPIEDLLPELPLCAVMAIRTGLAKDKWQRFGSAEDFLRALQGLPPITGRLSVGTGRPTLNLIRPDLINLCRHNEAPAEVARLPLASSKTIEIDELSEVSVPPSDIGSLPTIVALVPVSDWRFALRTLFLHTMIVLSLGVLALMTQRVLMGKVSATRNRAAVSTRQPQVKVAARDSTFETVVLMTTDVPEWLPPPSSRLASKTTSASESPPVRQEPTVPSVLKALAAVSPPKRAPRRDSGIPPLRMASAPLTSR